MMPPVLTADAMREADRATIEDLGIPGFVLMESAGRAACDAMERHLGPLRGRTVVCVCGKGNNGGDGLVVARTLLARGASVEIITLAGQDDGSPDNLENLRLLQALSETPGSGDRLTIARYDPDHPPGDRGASVVIVDALLGTGITSAPRGAVGELVDWINRQPGPVVALDLPTGLDSDTGRTFGRVVTADLTVTMAAAKVGLLMNGGPIHAGRVETVEIGIPGHLLETAAEQPGCARHIDDSVAALLPARRHDAHKFSVGFVLAVAGSDGLTGAAALASSAAERIGAGYVVCACPAGVQPILAGKFTTIMTLGLPETPAGTIALDALDLVLERAARANALLVGCGLGRDPATQEFVRELLRASTTPAIIDADGLNALAGHLDVVRENAEGQWILTPHWGEFRRLTGRDDIAIEDRLSLACAYAQEWNCVLLLKGMPSVVAAPDGRGFIGGAGNPALATAGTGDVLSGLCAGLRARGLSAPDAALCGLQVGGAVADAYADSFPAETMTATDLIEGLPRVLSQRFRRPYR